MSEKGKRLVNPMSFGLRTRLQLRKKPRLLCQARAPGQELIAEFTNIYRVYSSLRRRQSSDT